jgi:hypothetical protein
VSGELALESIAVDGQGQHHTKGRIHGHPREGTKLQRLRGPQAAGAHVAELGFLSHALGIGRRPAHL